jgi:hypothetical protein
MAASVWRAAWPVERIRQRIFFCYGMDVLLKLNLQVGVGRMCVCGGGASAGCTDAKSWPKPAVVCRILLSLAAIGQQARQLSSHGSAELLVRCPVPRRRRVSSLPPSSACPPTTGTASCQRAWASRSSYVSGRRGAGGELRAGAKSRGWQCKQRKGRKPGGMVSSKRARPARLMAPVPACWPPCRVWADAVRQEQQPGTQQPAPQGHAR